MAVNQRFTIQLGDTRYRFRLTWCPPAGSWMLDISDSLNLPIATGLPLVTGHDLLEQYEYLGIPGKLFVYSDQDADAIPSYDSLGDTGHLYFVPNAS